MITREMDYAIRTVLFLSKRPGELVSTAELADGMHIPYRFLRKIVKKLAEGGLIKSYKGKNGGVELNKNPEDVSVFDIVSLLSENGVYLNQCLGHPNCCKFSKDCNVHNKLENIQDVLEKKLREITFDSL